MTNSHYDQLLGLTAEYQRALNGRDKWQAKVDAAKEQIDQLMASAVEPTPTTPAPVPVQTPAPAPAPAEFANPAPVA